MHTIAPLIVALIFFGKKWKWAYLVFMLTMFVDLDHLLADPVFMTCRCSINFHLLHQYAFIGIFILMIFFKPTRLPGVGLSLHMLTDSIDCLFMEVVCGQS
jgi:hypothetical protein